MDYFRDMVIFITSLKRNAIRNPRFQKIFYQTITSIDAQTDRNFKILVVADADDVDALVDNRIEVVKVDFDDRFDHSSGDWFLEEGGCATSADVALRVDRGTKYAAGIIYARRYEVDYFVFFDSDDLISCRYVERLVGSKPSRGWVTAVGYMFNSATYDLTVLDDFNLHCGTCFAVRARMFDFPEILGSLNQAIILERLGAQYVTRVIGSHRFADKLFELEVIEDPLVMYRIGHDFNFTEIKVCKGTMVYLNSEICEEFSLEFS